MRVLARFAAAAAIATTTATAFAIGLSSAAGASERGGSGADRAVFVQTDNSAGNAIVAYHRADDGTLTLANTYSTGGLGGVLNGSAVDHLGSQGSLAYDSAHALLYAVNAGSNTVSVFSVAGDQLSLRQVIGSGGVFPVSIAVHGTLVYVLNAFEGANIAGFRETGGSLHPISGSTRPLGLLIPSDTSQFTHTPGQVAFSPDGSQLLVTTKANANGNDVDVFGVGADGRPSNSPVINSLPGTVPFAMTFDGSGHLVLAEAGPSALATFTLNGNGTITQIDSLASGQTGLCWVAPAGSFFFTGNTASNSTSGYESSASGTLTLLGATATDPGTVDASATPDGSFLYVQTGRNGIVDEFSVGSGGALSEVGHVTVANAAGGEGIVAA